MIVPTPRADQGKQRRFASLVTAASVGAFLLVLVVVELPAAEVSPVEWVEISVPPPPVPPKPEEPEPAEEPQESETEEVEEPDVAQQAEAPEVSQEALTAFLDVNTPAADEAPTLSLDAPASAAFTADVASASIATVNTEAFATSSGPRTFVGTQPLPGATGGLPGVADGGGGIQAASRGNGIEGGTRSSFGDAQAGNGDGGPPTQNGGEAFEVPTFEPLTSYEKDVEFDLLRQWMEAHPGSLPVGIRLQMGYRPGVLTARTMFELSGEGQTYELYLMYKQDIKELHIILVSGSTSSYLTDVPGQEETTKFEIGTVARGQDQEISAVIAENRAAGSAEVDTFWQVYQSWWAQARKTVN